ncbi:MAG: GNAT family N-acetyltransferase [Treponema sp.]|nr:GNAT family N-acetyltransferase [Treponema sp.]
MKSRFREDRLRDDRFREKRFWKTPGLFPSGETEAFLRKRERYCVGACFRYLAMREKSRCWYAEDGFLLYARRILFPVFDFGEEPRRLPLPRGLEKFLLKERLHAVQGLTRDVELLEAALSGIVPSEPIDYDLMELGDTGDSRSPLSVFLAEAESRGIRLRVPGPEDADALFPLQAGYDQEEVLPQSAVFNPAACRKNLEAIISTGLVLAAEYRGRLVGKINANAESFTRLQIGGVYVEPACRGRGIGGALTAGFIRLFASRGKIFTLFVKKRNGAARRIYDRIGFTKLADYRIDYFL